MASSSTLSMLPSDLIEEILCRTPTESLVRSMLTCKQWNNLINDKEFIYKHLDRSPVKFLRTDETTVYIMDPVTRTRSATPMPYNIRVMFHCDGLALWNPLTRKVSWVDKPSQPQFGTSDYYGIGYDNNKPGRDYKILKFSVRPNGEVVEVQIYECMSKSWRTLLYDTKVDWEVDLGSIGVAVKGNVYWLVKKELKHYILCFDFSDETFKDICFCCDLSYDNNYYLGCYDGDKLSLLQQNQEVASPIEVWVSSKLADGNVSFHQYFKVASTSIPPLLFVQFSPHPIYCIAKDKLFIAYYGRDEGDNNVSTSINLCEIDQGTGVISNELVAVRPLWDLCVLFRCGYVYVPSLVFLPV